MATTVTQRSWTYADYCRIPADRKRHEIIDGEHFVSPAPDVGHQSAVTRLVYRVMQAIEDCDRGRVFTSPIDVHLGRGTVVQPDLVVILPRNRSILGTKKITGAPDLVIEILSPSTRARDRRLKKDRYERAGVREFWLVDHEARTVEQFVLRNGRYGAARVHTDRIALRVLRDCTIDLRKVWGQALRA